MSIFNILLIWGKYFCCKYTQSFLALTSPSIFFNLYATLIAIQGRELDYLAFSFGKVKTENTLCTLTTARARIVETDSQRAVGIELVGDRFLRRMVRILVGKAISLQPLQQS